MPSDVATHRVLGEAVGGRLPILALHAVVEASEGLLHLGTIEAVAHVVCRVVSISWASLIRVWISRP